MKEPIWKRYTDIWVRVLLCIILIAYIVPVILVMESQKELHQTQKDLEALLTLLKNER